MTTFILFIVGYKAGCVLSNIGTLTLGENKSSDEKASAFFDVVINLSILIWAICIVK